MKDVQITADYEYVRPRRYVFHFVAGRIYREVEDPIAAAIELDGAGRIIGESAREQRK